MSRTHAHAGGAGRPFATTRLTGARSNGNAVRRGIDLTVVFALLAAGLTAIVVLAGPFVPSAGATTSVARMCSGAEVSGLFTNRYDDAFFKIDIPWQATYKVQGSVDVVGAAPDPVKYQTILHFEPGYWSNFGDYWNPTNNNGFGPVTVTQNTNSDGHVNVHVYQDTDTSIRWRVTYTIVSGGGTPVTGPCAPLSVEETTGVNCPEPHAESTYTSAADPVNTATGNFNESFTDLVVPGRGPGLAFGHSYNSLQTGTQSRPGVDGPLGYGWTHTYAASLELGTDKTIVRQETGAEVPFYRDDSGGFEPTTRAVASLVHNADGTYTFKRCNNTTIVFSSTGQMLSVADRNGYTTTLQYSAGRLSTVTDSANRKLHVTWTGNHVTSVADDTGRTVSFGYDGSGNLTDQTDIGGATWHFTYNASHHLLTMRRPSQAGKPNPLVTTNVYDSLGRVTSQTDELNRTTLIDYTSVPGSTKVTDPKGNLTLETYNNLVRTSTTRGYGTPLAATWTFEVDPYTLGITKVTDPLNHVRTATYDRNGNMTAQTDAPNHKTVATYNGFDQPLTVTDANQVTTTFTYDATGNLASVSTPLVGSSPAVARMTMYGYDPTRPGDLTSVTDPRGKVWSAKYDSVGNLVETTDPLSGVERYRYDSVGLLTSTLSARGVAAGLSLPCTPPAMGCTTFSHDGWGHVSVTTDANGHQSTDHYNNDGNLDYTIDGDNNRTDFLYDVAGQPTSVQRADATTTRTDYWPDGSVQRTYDGANKATAYAYDALGRLISVTDPNNRTTTYGYDPAGNPVTKADPGGTCPSWPITYPPTLATSAKCTVMGYDATDRLTSVKYSDGATPAVAYGYDNVGRRTSMSDGTGASAWAWDSLGRLTSSTDGAGHVIAYGYANRRDPATTITYGPGRAVTRAFDDAGRMTSLTDWLNNTTTFTPDADSNIATVTFPSASGLADSYGFDKADRLTSVTNKAAGVTRSSLTYTRDGADQVASVASTGAPADIHSYTYTPLNQLKNDGAATNYGYDPADNLTAIPGATTLAYDNANQLTTMTRPTAATTFGYDSRGNRTSATTPGVPATTLGYDQANRLISVGVEASSAVLSEGWYHSLVAKPDGSVWAWGYNNYGQLGNNSTAESHLPLQVPGLSGVVAVAAGSYQSTALKGDGTVWTWGANNVGQLGIGSNADSHVPVQIPELAGVVAIAAGVLHTLALKSDGTVWAWGYNSNGQLGDNSITSRVLPVQVQGLSGVIAVAGGYQHSAALTSDGKVWTWGYNASGQLGTGSTAETHVAGAVPGLSGVTAIATGWFHTLARRSDATVWAWGSNSNGQLGNGSITNLGVPTQIPNLTGVASVAASTYQSFAQKTDASMWGWGYNAFGQFGNGSTAEPHVPAATGFGGVKGFAPGPNQTLALRADGTLIAAGLNSFGALGNGTTVDTRIPVTVLASAPADLSATVSAGWYHSLALKADGTVSAWGWNAYGQLGDGSVTDRTAPVAVVGLSGIVAVSAGGYSSLALKSDGTVWAWGWNGVGQLGDNTTVDRNTPVQVPGLTGVVAIAAGAAHGLALKGDGTVWAWGYNSNGQLGDATTADRHTPIQAPGLTGVSAIAGGYSHSLALKADGTVRAWGYNGYGQLGDGTVVDRHTPVPVAGLSGVTSISAGWFHNLARKADATVAAWGNNGQGQLGNNTVNNAVVPGVVPGLAGVDSVAAGGYHSSVLKADSTVWSWGLNNVGQLGDNSTTERHAPVPVNLANVTALATDYVHVLAPRSDGALSSWGYNPYGELGNGTVAEAHAPVGVTGFNRGGAAFNRGSGALATYAYNGDGRRSAKTVAGVTTRFTWDSSAGLPLLLEDGTTSYIYGPDGRPVEHIANGVATWYHHDQLGSTRTLTNAAGAVVATATYSDYGTPTATTGKLSPLGFAGEYTDAETGFIYLRARYYDPGTGQFLTIDPAYVLTGSRYGYVGGNPLNGIDPSGLCGMVLGPVLVMSCPPPQAGSQLLPQPGAARGPVNTGSPPSLDLWGRLITRPAPPMSSVNCAAETGDLPALGHRGVLDGELPPGNRPLSSWKPEELQQLRDDLVTSLANRKAEIGRDFPFDPADYIHPKRIQDETDLLRAVEKALSGS